MLGQCGDDSTDVGPTLGQPTLLSGRVMELDQDCLRLWIGIYSVPSHCPNQYQIYCQQDSVTHWGRDEIDSVLQTTFSNTFSWMKMYEFRLEFHWRDPINNIQALVQIMAWRRLGDKPLFEPMMLTLLTHICVTRPQWVKEQTMKSDSNTITFNDTNENDIWKCVLQNVRHFV